MSRYASAHENPQGIGDSRPTALQIVEDNDLMGKLSGKVAIVTGVSSGIGISTAIALKATGMRVIGLVRNIPKATKVLEKDLEPGHLELLEVDLSSLASVRACAAEIKSKTSVLNLFIANAGIMATPPGKTIDGFDRQFGTNHLSHFLLFQLLAPLLLASATPTYPSRAVMVSSVGHRLSEINWDDLNFDQGYDPMAAYAQSKLANIYTANEIERRYGSRHLHAWSVMPGGIWTGLQDDIPAELKQAWQENQDFMNFWKSLDQGAATTVWAAIDKELENRGGKYLEDCAIAAPAPKPMGQVEDAASGGYAEWAYDEENEKRLWKVSCEMVGVEDVVA